MKKRMTTVTATADAKPDVPEMVVSTADLDRDSDRLLPEGADLAAFRRNPALIWGHDYRELPIGTVEWIDVEPGRGLRARWRWLEGDNHASRVRNAWNQGVVRAASVGFIPKKSAPNDFGGHDITAWELLEVSLVAIPANPHAIRILKDLGLLEDPQGDHFLDVVDWPGLGGFAKANLHTPFRSGELFDVDTGMLNRMVAKQIREHLRPVVAAACEAGVKKAFGSQADYVEVEGWNPRRGRQW